MVPIRINLFTSDMESIPQVQQWQQHKGYFYDRATATTAKRNPGDPIDPNKAYSFELKTMRDLTQ
jgi:hypothetical protein